MSETIVEDARRFIRAHSTADIRFDEHLRPLKYVISPEGRLAAPVMVAMIQSFDTVLFVPEYAEDSMEVQVTLDPFAEHGPQGTVADRWRIFHGEPPDVRWAFMDVDAVRYQGQIIDGGHLSLENPLAEVEASLCRMLNQRDRDELRALCRRFCNGEVESPVVVSVDEGGILVRRSFDVVRVESPELMHPHNAESVLKSMLQSAVANS